ncbi:MAG: hypothetical protein ACRD8U_16400 [Pyrinomonadaceae bacterium]
MTSQHILGHQDPESRRLNAAIARELTSLDPLTRQRAAEELARLAAVDQKKLLEGYYLQEKDRKVRLALEWALYRVGRTESLFRVVRELDSSRHDQAIRYLKQVDSPSLLYAFLKQKDNPARVTVGLLETLGDLGDSETLELLKPYRESFASGVAEAAEIAIDKIEVRLAQNEPSRPGRPRTVDKTQPTSP